MGRSIAPEEGEVPLRVNGRERHQHGLDIRPLEVSHHTVIGFFKMGKPCERFVLRFRKNGDFVPLKVAIVPAEFDERIIACNTLIQILAKQGIALVYRDAETRAVFRFYAEFFAEFCKVFLHQRVVAVRAVDHCALHNGIPVNPCLHCFFHMCHLLCHSISKFR